MCDGDNSVLKKKKKKKKKTIPHAAASIMCARVFLFWGLIHISFHNLSQFIVHTHISGCVRLALLL